ncbi:MAG: polysaccharide biosynthesis tyrosine autokinase [Acidimicrobiales bacterium]
MDVRRGLEVLRRHLVLVVQAVAVVGVLAGVLSSLRSPVYHAAAKVLLRPPDAAGDVLSANRRPLQSQFDADRQVIGQIEIIRSREVVADAAKRLDVPVERVHTSMAVSQRPSSDVVNIGARNVDPTMARDMANALARAYLDNRREQAVSQLRAASRELEAKLAELQGQIATYDGQVAARTPQQAGPAATATPEAPAPGVAPGASAATVPEPTDPGLNLGGQPTSVESLKAARYASAVQYNSLFAKQQELLVQTSLKEADAELVALARLPAGPVSPKPVRDGLVGALFGFVLGAGWAFVRERLDDRIRSRTELEELSGLPVLAELPRVDAAPGEELVAAFDPVGPFAEAVRALRTSVDFLGLQAPITRVAVTSPSPGDGKSRVAANLAAAYAQSGYRTILVSADLRRSRAEEVVGADGGPGLSGAIAGMAAAELSSGGDRSAPDLAAMLVDTPVENLRLLPSGTSPPNPAELLRSHYTDLVLEQLGRLADRVVIDTPPVVAVTDAVVLGPKADGVIIVASMGETERDAVRRARELLDATPARLLGVVANKVPITSQAYRYSYSEQPPQAGRKGRSRRSASVPEPAASRS